MTSFSLRWGELVKYSFCAVRWLVMVTLLQWIPISIGSIPFRSQFSNLRHRLTTIASRALLQIHAKIGVHERSDSSCHRTLFDDTPYSRRMKAARDVVRDLPLEQNDRVAAKAVPPKILVVGSPGAGKSSLIYALTQIPVHKRPGEIEPESTRCPVLVQVRSSTTAPTCEVGIQPVNILTPRLFERVNDTQMFPEVIRRAQTSVINSVQGEAHRLSEDLVRAHFFGAATDIDMIEVPGIDAVSHPNILLRMTPLESR